MRKITKKTIAIIILLVMTLSAFSFKGISPYSVSAAEGKKSLQIVSSGQDGVSIGAKTTFSVQKSGDFVSYQWYYRKAGASKWSKWNGHNTASTSAVANASWDKMQVKCVVTKTSGSKVTTSPLTVRIKSTKGIKIEKQPADVITRVGKTVGFSVTATGSNLAYQWYYRKKGASSWTLWKGHTSASTTATANMSWNGMTVYCKVKDKNGSTASSKAAAITVADKLSIVKQPEKSIRFSAGDMVTIKLSAQGTGLSYQWYYKKSGASKWSKWNGHTTASTSAKSNATWNGMKVYCVVKDITGSSVSSGTCTLTAASKKTLSTEVDVSAKSYVAPTGNTTDMTSSIVFMLNQYGICQLGIGVYYVSGINMPDDTILIGSGTKTIIRLTDSGTYAIKMNKRNKVSNLSIDGGESDITLSETLGTRHGILWQGNFSQTKNYSKQPSNGILDGLWIHGFDGGGITCSDTSYGTTNSISATNINISNCNAGINIAYWSEYHKFTNIRTSACYYGCINNGGNNMFANCDFSSSKLGFLMDNTNNKSPNNSHGSAVGCSFNHASNSKGIGIKIIGCPHGYMFTGCQIFFSQIDIKSSSGIVFNSCNFGDTNNDITISGGGAILFSNNMHQSQPKISVTNNNAVRFVNCYIRSTGAVVSN